MSLWKGVLFPIQKIAFSAEKAVSFRFGKIRFSDHQDARIASRLFWRPQKAYSFKFGKIYFLREKAISFRFCKIAFSGRHVARTCVKVVLTLRESVPFQVRQNRLWQPKKWLLSSLEKSLLQVANWLEIVVAPWEPCSFRLEKIILSWKKRFLSHLENSHFQVAKTLDMALKKRHLSGSEKSIYQLKMWFLSGSDNRFFSSPKCWKLCQSCFGSLKKVSFQVQKNHLSTCKSDFFQVRKSRFFSSSRCSK